MTVLQPKISIIGAGNVGMRYAYSLMMSGLARSIVVVDRDAARAEGEVLDLASGMPFVSPVKIAAGGFSEIKGSKLVVITAGKKQLPGQSRLDLTRENIALYKELIPQLSAHAPEAVYLVVTNPVDVMAYAAYRISGKPWQQVIGSGTVLDSARLRFLVSEHCGIDARNVHAYILGEHGDSEFAVWSRAMFGGTLLEDYCFNCHKCKGRQERERIFKDVRDYAYRIIERKGETSYGIGLALVRISEAILKDENAVLSVSCLGQDFYGTKDLYMSMPAVVNKNGVREVLRVQFDPGELESLKASAAAIREIIQKLTF
ncbi:MAG: L-lactate dehydrogenase [Candidatus Omnitrophota bacterium]